MNSHDLTRLEAAVKQVVGEILAKDMLDDLMLELESQVDDLVDRAVDEVDCDDECTDLADTAQKLEDAKYENRRWRELMAQALNAPLAFVDLPYAERHIECR
jgi:hypothetical protein